MRKLRAQWGYQVRQYTTGVVITGTVKVHGQLVIVKVVACEKALNQRRRLSKLMRIQPLDMHVHLWQNARWLRSLLTLVTVYVTPPWTMEVADGQYVV